MGVYVEPFDFATIFLNYFVGNKLIFIYLFFIVFSYACAYFQMSNRNFTIILVISSVSFALYTEQGLMFMALFLIGYTIFKIFSKD